MRPTGGLAEKWIIPILREVAEAVYWVHSHGVIHRDIKCANVLITDIGGVQLCDFGVAGIIETKFDKRSTITGTLQWMAPELFDSSISYGIEVDIWAFGSMAYEVATGLPPNATGQVDIANFGPYLKNNCPRLEGDQYSPNLRDIITYCLVQDPAQRPSIEQVQTHPYISDSKSQFPTTSLSQLVNDYKLWEIQGGTRQSLFSAGGAQAPANISPPSPNDEGNFETIHEADLKYSSSDSQAVRHAYGPNVRLPSKLSKQPGRRRQPHVKPLIVPLEQIFDPSFSTNYNDNARVFYGYNIQQPISDLSLRDELNNPSVRESLIDLDASLDGNRLSQFIGTIRPGPQSAPDEQYQPSRCLTQEWKFPLMAPVSASLDHTKEDPKEKFVLNVDARDLFISHPTSNMQANRASAMSLIDLDASTPNDPEILARPPTAGSDIISIGSEIRMTSFELEEHIFDAAPSLTVREPSIYTSDDVSFAGPDAGSAGYLRDQTVHLLDEVLIRTQPIRASQSSSLAIPAPLSRNVMLGIGTQKELKEELQNLIRSLGEHLQFASETLARVLTKRGA